LHYIGVDDRMIEEAQRETATMPPGPQARFADLFTPEYARRVIHTWSMWFLSAFSAYAFSVWLPTIYATYYHISLTRTLTYTFIVAGTQVVARVFAFSMIERLGRKPLIIIGFGTAGLAALLFTQATTETSLLYTAMLYAFFADIGSLAMTVYTPEVYPLRIRGIGASLAMGWGRFGGMISPLVAGMLLGTNNITLVWCMMAAFQLTSAGITLVLARETRGRNLELVSQTA
jgi:putative MFS transporter